MMEDIYEILQNLKIVQRAIKHQMHDHFKSLNMTAPQGMMVFMLSKKGPMKISEISEKMSLSNSTVSGIVDRLEKMDYVKRERSEKDRRVVRVVLTENVKSETKDHEVLMEKFMAQSLESASVEELQVIKQGLGTLSRLVNKVKGDITEC